jgi:crotonobetainyl-CoA:carnitine CoA-transferase CaiB-like acyl-CoA transferase
MQPTLSGVRVLDFTRVLAGPLCTMLLGDMGADVIKVESPKGDDTRQWGPPWLGGESAYYLALNRNKRSIVLNLKTAEGQETARALALKSHIVVENFKPGEMAKFKLDYETLKADNPALVFASITGFGQTGPYKDRPGYDHVIQAMSGLMSITGADEPFKVGVAVSDVLTGMFALSGILAALRHAELTGEGQHLDFALLDSQIAGLVNIASNALVSGETPPTRISCRIRHSPRPMAILWCRWGTMGSSRRCVGLWGEKTSLLIRVTVRILSA